MKYSKLAKSTYLASDTRDLFKQKNQKEFSAFNSLLYNKRFRSKMKINQILSKKF